MALKTLYSHNIILLSFLVIFGYADKLSPLLIKQEIKKYLGFPQNSVLNFTELTAKNGYLSEEHTVVTKDGYVLTLFRIVKGRNCKERKSSTPVLMMHGLLQSADCWIDSGPRAGLAYLISDACHDMWVGNTRGNYYSRAHTTLDPDKDSQYWKFCVDEIGLYDVPAMIDYVLQHTGSEKLNYIGYSQGAGTFFVMCSELPHYCDKVKVMIALAPATRHTYCKSKIFRLSCIGIEVLEETLSKANINEVFAIGDVFHEFLKFFCLISSPTLKICEGALNMLASAGSNHPGSITDKSLRSLLGHFPAGTSVHNMARYGQSMGTEHYQKFDYGREGNIQLYGSADPPKYNLSAVTVPVVTFYSKNDGIVDAKDVEWTLAQIPQVLEVMLVNNSLWNHLDMTYSRFIPDLVFPKIYEYLSKYSTK